MNYVTKVVAKSTDKKASEIGILINASSLTTDTLFKCYAMLFLHIKILQTWDSKIHINPADNWICS